MWFTHYYSIRQPLTVHRFTWRVPEKKMTKGRRQMDVLGWNKNKKCIQQRWTELLHHRMYVLVNNHTCSAAMVVVPSDAHTLSTKIHVTATRRQLDTYEACIRHRREWEQRKIAGKIETISKENVWQTAGDPRRNGERKISSASYYMSNARMY